MTFDNEEDKRLLMFIIANHQLEGPYHKVGPSVKTLDKLMQKVEQAEILDIRGMVKPVSDIKRGKK